MKQADSMNHGVGRRVTRDEFFYVLQDNYDEHAEVAIPGYREMHAAMVELLGNAWRADGKDTLRRVLDLGAGTGRTAAYLLREHTRCDCVCIELFDEMLAHAETRFKQAGVSERVRLVHGDFITTEFESEYDACVAVLAIHHQDQAGKRELFRRVCEALKPGGYFVMIDWIKHEEPWKNEASLEAAERHVRAAMEQAAGSSKREANESGKHWSEIADAWVEHWRVKNMPDTEKDLCEWLVDGGFRGSFCAVKHFGMALIYAVK